MKSYTITVNGNVYNVTVEENTGAAPAAPVQAAPASAAPAAPVKPAEPVGTQGSVKVESPVAGKIFKLEASVGQSVSKGDTILILESMKMEIPVVAPQDGTVAGFNKAAGDSVEAGDIIATLN